MADLDAMADAAGGGGAVHTDEGGGQGEHDDEGEHGPGKTAQAAGAAQRRGGCVDDRESAGHVWGLRPRHLRRRWAVIARAAGT